jgi:hypothetical protein
MSPPKAILCSFCLLAMLSNAALAAAKVPIGDEPLIKARKWEEAQAFYAKSLVEFAEAKGPKADSRLMRLVLCYDISRCFGQLSGEDITDLTDWLLDQPDFTATLLRAFIPKDSP